MPRKYGIEVRAQFGEGNVLTDADPHAELDSALVEDLKASIDDRLVEFECGDAVDQEASGDLLSFEHSNGVAFAREFVGTSEASGAGTDDGHFEAIGGCAQGGERLMVEGVFVDESFDGPDADWFGAAIQNAMTFAKPFLGTDPAADFGQVAGRPRQLRRFEEMTFRRQCQPFRNSIVQGASLDTGGFGALDASACLLPGGGLIEARGDFEEIGYAIDSGTRSRFFPQDLEPSVLVVGLLVHRLAIRHFSGQR